MKPNQPSENMSDMRAKEAELELVKRVNYYLAKKVTTRRVYPKMTMPGFNELKL